MKKVIASNGMIAYPLPAWTREKLWYIKNYMQIFCVGMSPHWSELVYADLLAGPGRCVDTDNQEEQSGSALLAVQRTEFARLFINDYDASVTRVLARRLGDQPEERVQISTDDCNVAVTEARRFLFPSSSARTLGLAVIDPQAYQMRFDAIADLTDGLSMDLIIIFMTSYARRFIDQHSFESRMDGFFGTPDWRQFVEDKNLGERLTYAKLLKLYERQLASIGYTHVDNLARTANDNGAHMYHIVFASRHPRGADFFKKIRQRTFVGQVRLAI